MPKRKHHAIAVQMVEVIEELRQRVPRSGDPREDAEVVVMVLAEYFGGLQIYLPRGDKLRETLAAARAGETPNGPTIGDRSS